MVRAVARYLRQVGIPFSDRYMEETLLAHADVAASWSSSSTRASTRPATARGPRTCAREIEERDRRRRQPRPGPDPARLPVGRARDAAHQLLPPGPKPYVSFKLDPTQIPLTPLPRPRFEIFVHSPRVEGVHLRGGSVARGGLRWSRPARGLPHRDPRPDEGADGQERADRAGRREGRVRGQARRRRGRRVLHDVHQRAAGHHRHDLAAGEVVPPADVVRHDGDDPYLVVAADKGTATFSDIANGVAEQYGFWLGDAFASGGSVGYDHKAMGITARSAWVSVQRHFRELGVDVQAEDFTVAGVGDMSGDVFGNGMLLSRAHPARGGVRPPPRLPRSEPGRGVLVRRAAAAVRAAALVVGRLRRVADLRGRRHLPAHGEVDRAVASRCARRWTSTPSG